MFNKNWI